MKMMKKISVCCLSIFAVSGMLGGFQVFQGFAPENSLVSAVDTAVSAEPKAVFSDVSAQAGKPVHVTLENLTADTISYEWTVGGKKISNSSDSYTPTEQDYEKLISCTVTADGKEYTASMYFSELPVVYINTNDGQDITSKEEYADKIETSALADTQKWHSGTDWAEEVSKTKDYVKNRYQWFDTQFTSPENLAESLGYDASDNLEITNISTDNGKVVVTATAVGVSAETITFHVNGKYAGESKIQDDLTATLEISPSLLEKNSNSLNTVQIRMKDADGNYLKSSSTGRGGWGGWNPWEQTTSSTSTVYSNFATFTADYNSLVKTEYSVSDVKILQDWLHGKKVTIPEGKNYDLNQDGIWNICDLALLKKILMK